MNKASSVENFYAAGFVVTNKKIIHDGEMDYEQEISNMDNHNNDDHLLCDHVVDKNSNSWGFN